MSPVNSVGLQICRIIMSANTNYHLPSQGTSFSDGARQASTTSSANHCVPSLFGAKCSHEYLHVRTKTPPSTFEMHLILSLRDTVSLRQILHCRFRPVMRKEAAASQDGRARRCDTHTIVTIICATTRWMRLMT